MQPENQVLLISNYRQDKQFSMLKFGKLLINEEYLYEDIHIEEIFPLPVFRKFMSTGGLSKWAAYIDKFLIFPKRVTHYLKKKSNFIGLVHIVDHSNAPYLNYIGKSSSAKRLLTCHDLIAIQTAFGDYPIAPKTSITGIKLQSWIRNSFHFADYFTCDSHQTQKNLNQIFPHTKSISNVIHLGTEFNKLNSSSSSCDCSFDLPKTPFILHVGSAAWYKNRKAVLETYRHLRQIDSSNDLKLVLVGPAPQSDEMNDEMKKWVQCNLDNIYSFSNVSDQLLCSFYKNAVFLIFPSFIEGFGWPPLEAMSVGCRVITTKTGAIHDLLGDNALYIDPSDQKSINKKAVKLYLGKKKIIKHKVSLPSYENCRKNYLQLYRELLED